MSRPEREKINKTKKRSNTSGITDSQRFVANNIFQQLG
jgi:hypothetical protein